MRVKPPQGHEFVFIKAGRIVIVRSHSTSEEDARKVLAKIVEDDTDWTHLGND